MQEMWVRSLGLEDLLEKEMATHSYSAWEIPWTEEPDRLQPLGSQRVGQDWTIEHSTAQFSTYRLTDAYFWLCVSRYFVSCYPELLSHYLWSCPWKCSIPQPLADGFVGILFPWSSAVLGRSHIKMAPQPGYLLDPQKLTDPCQAKWGIAPPSQITPNTDFSILPIQPFGLYQWKYKFHCIPV